MRTCCLADFAVPMDHSCDDTVIYIYIDSCRIHTDTMNNRRRKTSLPIFTSHFICKGSKRFTQGLRVRGSWRSNITAIFWPHCYDRQRCVFLVLHSAGCWLSLLHLISIFSGPQFIWAPGVAFPTTSRLQLAATQLALHFRLDCVI